MSPGARGGGSGRLSASSRTFKYRMIPTKDNDAADVTNEIGGTETEIGRGQEGEESEDGPPRSKLRAVVERQTYVLASIIIATRT